MTYNKSVADHIWWPTADQHNEMISLLVTADPTEAIMWNSISLQAAGSGNDFADISAVNIWLDNNDDAVVDAGDTLIGTGTYPVDNGLANIGLTAPQLIPAGGSVKVLVSYTMTAAAAFGGAYGFDVTAASGTGQISGALIAATVMPSPLRSAKKIASTAPIKIGPAKRLPPGAPFLLVDKEITADFLPPTMPAPWNWFYIEEPDRSSGIGVIGGLTGPLHVGDRISIMGVTTLVNASELMVTPSYIEVTYHDPAVRALAMNSRSTGGGVFGLQPAVVNEAWFDPPSYAVGLNNIGMLIRTCGRVTGSGGVSLGGTSWVDVVWLYDGFALHDGYTTTMEDHSLGIAVAMPPDAPGLIDGYWMVTGILKATANPAGNPIRLLVPRSYSEMTECPSPW